MKQNSKREKWYRLMQEYEQSGKSVTEWCAKVGCTHNTFRYWRYRVRIQETYQCDEASLPGGWIKGVLPAGPEVGGVAIRIGAAEIVAHRGFDHALLREVVEALS